MYLPDNVSLTSSDGVTRITKSRDEVNPYLVYHLGTCTVHKNNLEDAIKHCTERYKAKFPKEKKVLAKDIKRGMIVCTEGYPYGSVRYNNRNKDENEVHHQLVLFSQDTITLDASAVLTVLV